jgi:hypothetical protein
VYIVPENDQLKIKRYKIRESEICVSYIKGKKSTYGVDIEKIYEFMVKLNYVVVYTERKGSIKKNESKGFVLDEGVTIFKSTWSNIGFKRGYKRSMADLFDVEVVSNGVLQNPEGIVKIFLNQSVFSVVLGIFPHFCVYLNYV